LESITSQDFAEPAHSKKTPCGGNCGDCAKAARGSTDRDQTKGVPPYGKHSAFNQFRRLQSIIGILLLLSSGIGTYLLSTDASLWLLAFSHAVGLMIIVAIDLVLGLYSLASPKSAYLPSAAAAFLGFILQLGDVLTAPQYNMTIAYFAHYLFGLWAFDLLLGLQFAVVIVGVIARPHAKYLARRRTKRGQEFDYSRRGLLKAMGGLAGLIGIGVLLGSLKLAGPVQQGTQTSQSSAVTTTKSGAGSVANVNTLQVGAPVLFEYPAGYPSSLVKNKDGSLTAVSMLCTHVCCQCSYDAASNVYYCPCHGSIFDLTGRVVRGPASTDLPTIQLRIDGAGDVFPVGVSNPGPCQV
jgi:arsenite oxidase small subunit